MAASRCTFTPRPPLRPCREAMVYDPSTVTQVIEFCRHEDCHTAPLPRLVPEHDVPYWIGRDDAPRWLDYVAVPDEADKCPCLETPALIIVVGPQGRIIRSDDCGVTWEGMDNPPPIDWEAVAYCEGKLVAVGHGDKGAYSLDQGLTWSEFDMPLGNWDAIACCGGRLMVIDSQGAGLAVTEAAGDLSAWDTPAVPWTSPVTYHFCNCLDGVSVIAGGAVYKTIDGLTWAGFFQGEAEIIFGYWTPDLPGDVYVASDGLELREQECCDDPATCNYGVSKPIILTPSIPNCLVNTVYNSFAPLVQITGTDGWRPYTWSAENLPPGLSIEPLTGRIVGSPTAVGDYTDIEITLTDFIGQKAVRLYSMTVYALPIIGDPPRIITETIPAAAIGQYYRAWINGMAGALPYRWTVTVKPDWLDIDLYTGELRGAAPFNWSLAGTTVPVTVVLTDLNDLTDTKTYTLTFGHQVYPGDPVPGPPPPGEPWEPGGPGGPGDPGGGSSGGGGGCCGGGTATSDDPLGGGGSIWGPRWCWEPDPAKPSEGYTETFIAPFDGIYLIAAASGGGGGGGARVEVRCVNRMNFQGTVPAAVTTFIGNPGPAGGYNAEPRKLTAGQAYSIRVGEGGKGGDGGSGSAGQASSAAWVTSAGGSNDGLFTGGEGGEANNDRPMTISQSCVEYCREYHRCFVYGASSWEAFCATMKPCDSWTVKGGDGKAGSVCIFYVGPDTGGAWPDVWEP